LAALRNLEELDIDCFYFEPSTGKKITQYQLGDDAAEVLASFPNLRTLMVFQTQISDKGLAALCRLERLETLVVSSPNVTSASFDPVLKLKHLKHLGTWQWKINDADFEKLSQLPNLRSLGLVTRLSDESVTRLSKLGQIERLTMRGDKITDGSLPNLARLTKLEWLDISDTSVNKNSPAAKELQRALPRCQINLPRTKEEEEMHRAFINSRWSSVNSASDN
jgi:Leucine-rich repeat (LRR) protein